MQNLETKSYVSSKGYKITVRRGGIGARNSFRPRTNDFSIESIIDAAMNKVCRWGWTDRETAQRVLNDLATEQGWAECKK